MRLRIAQVEAPPASFHPAKAITITGAFVEESSISIPNSLIDKTLIILF